MDIEEQMDFEKDYIIKERPCFLYVFFVQRSSTGW